MMAESVITDHAALRYLERVLKVDVEARRFIVRQHGGDGSDGEVLSLLERHGEVRVAALKRRMLSPAVRFGLMRGATGATVDGVIYVLHGGCVVTCYQVDTVRKERRRRLQRGRVSVDAALLAGHAWEMEDAAYG